MPTCVWFLIHRSYSMHTMSPFVPYDHLQLKFYFICYWNCYAIFSLASLYVFFHSSFSNSPILLFQIISEDNILLDGVKKDLLFLFYHLKNFGVSNFLSLILKSVTKIKLQTWFKESTWALLFSQNKLVGSWGDSERKDPDMWPVVSVWVPSLARAVRRGLR